MNLTKLFSKSALLLLMTASLAACDGSTNATSGVDDSGQSEVVGAVEEDPIELEVTDDTLAQAEGATGQSEVEGAVEDSATDMEEMEDETFEQTEDAENVTTEEVADGTEGLIGQTVTIRSDALEVIEPASFVVADQDFFGGEDILILNASGEIFELPEDDTEVQVTGEVVKFILADVESEYALDLDPDLYIDYEEQPAIIAQSIAAAPEPGEIAADPTQYYGQTLAVTGEIETVYSDNTFTLDEDELFGGQDLLVVVVSPMDAAVQDGETVAVTGELRSFVTADFETDYDLTWDLDVQEQIEAEYSERPVLVVNQVYPSAIPE